MDNLFKVGDRVKGIRPPSQGYSTISRKVIGEIGTIIGTKQDGHQIYLVEFDKYISGHDGRSRGYAGKLGHCWWCEEAFLQSMNEKDVENERNARVIAKIKVLDERYKRRMENKKVLKKFIIENPTLSQEYQITIDDWASTAFYTRRI